MLVQLIQVENLGHATQPKNYMGQDPKLENDPRVLLVYKKIDRIFSMYHYTIDFCG